MSSDFPGTFDEAPASDAERWDAKYRDAPIPRHVSPPELVRTSLADIATLASVLDVAAGWGDAGLWLADAGADVTLTDVSAVALAAAEARAADDDLTVKTIVRDLATSSIPQGPWDAITCIHYLDRSLLPRLGNALAPGGRLVVAIATTTNRERHDRPSARFLLDPGELPLLVPDLDITNFSEGWRSNDVHEAWLVATAPMP